MPETGDTRDLNPLIKVQDRVQRVNDFDSAFDVGCSKMALRHIQRCAVGAPMDQVCLISHLGHVIVVECFQCQLVFGLLLAQ
jgi:hypothetical protein